MHRCARLRPSPVSRPASSCSQADRFTASSAPTSTRVLAARLAEGRCRSAAPCLASRMRSSMSVRIRCQASTATALAGVDTSVGPLEPIHRTRITQGRQHPTTTRQPQKHRLTSVEAHRTTCPRTSPRGEGFGQGSYRARERPSAKKVTTASTSDSSRIGRAAPQCRVPQLKVPDGHRLDRDDVGRGKARAARVEALGRSGRHSDSRGEVGVGLAVDRCRATAVTRSAPASLDTATLNAGSATVASRLGRRAAGLCRWHGAVARPAPAWRPVQGPAGTVHRRLTRCHTATVGSTHAYRGDHRRVERPRGGAV